MCIRAYSLCHNVISKVIAIKWKVIFTYLHYYRIIQLVLKRPVVTLGPGLGLVRHWLSTVISVNGR